TQIFGIGNGFNAGEDQGVNTREDNGRGEWTIIPWRPSSQTNAPYLPYSRDTVVTGARLQRPALQSMPASRASTNASHGQSDVSWQEGSLKKQEAIPLSVRRPPTDWRIALVREHRQAVGVMKSNWNVMARPVKHYLDL